MLWLRFPTSKTTYSYFHVHAHAVVGLEVVAAFSANPGIILSLQVQPLVVPPGRRAHRRGRLGVRGFCFENNPLSAEGGGFQVSVDLVHNCEITKMEKHKIKENANSPKYDT